MVPANGSVRVNENSRPGSATVTTGLFDQFGPRPCLLMALNRAPTAGPVAPSSQVLFNPLGCMVSLNDLCDRPPVMADPASVHEIGGHAVRTIPTPHVPHGWEAQVLFDESTRTLFCGDLFTRTGEGPALVHDADLIQPALDAEDLFGATALTPATAPTIRRLADLEPRTLALMHGPAFAGDCRQALLDLADAYEARLTASLDLTDSGASS